jgi:hypothetical protein
VKVSSTVLKTSGVGDSFAEFNGFQNIFPGAIERSSHTLIFSKNFKAENLGITHTKIAPYRIFGDQAATFPGLNIERSNFSKAEEFT